MKPTPEEALKSFATSMQEDQRFFQHQMRRRPPFQARLFKSPVKLPEARSGDLRIVHEHWPAGKSHAIVSMREAFCTGKPPLSVRMPNATTIHQLQEVGQGVWMTDMPVELNQMAEAVVTAQPTGNVLVGGLGLGILPGILHGQRRSRGITSITVVERSSDVLRLCAVKGQYDVEMVDIRRFITAHRQPFHCYMLDTWQGQNEMAYWEHVLPLRRAIRNLWGTAPRIWCWKEDEMQGQVYRVLRGPYRVWHYEGLLPSFTHEEAVFFLEQVGMPEWEKRYGAAVDKQMWRTA